VSQKVDFYRHQLGTEEAEAVAAVIDSLFLTTGPRTKELEDALAARLGLSHMVGVSSCTTGLFLALEALGIGEGDEVITTPMTFIATSNVVLHARAKPVFADVEPDTGNLDVAAVEAAITPRTKAIIPVHLYGQMADMRALSALAKKRGLAIIEDAAHSVEAERDGVKPGGLADAVAFSFYATKNLSCGEGGSVGTNRADVDEAVRRLRLHGMTKDAYGRYHGSYTHWDMTALGYKANLPDILSALLLPQLGKIDEKLARREALAKTYDEALSRIEGVTLPKVRPNSRHSRHLYTIWVDPERRDAVLSHLQAQGIGVAVNYRAVHLLTYYREKFGYQRGTFPNAERIGDSTISLPFHPNMDHGEVAIVAREIQNALRR
jgi:UDP-4-amino-4-deoxy-L-arabinose-oxoglutarate aminotransferase